MTDLMLSKPDIFVNARDVFGIDADIQVPAFSERDAHVPEIDEQYQFNMW